MISYDFDNSLCLSSSNSALFEQNWMRKEEWIYILSAVCNDILIHLLIHLVFYVNSDFWAPASSYNCRVSTYRGRFSKLKVVLIFDQFPLQVYQQWYIFKCKQILSILVLLDKNCTISFFHLFSPFLTTFLKVSFFFSYFR